MPKRHYPASIPFFGRYFRPAQDHWAYSIDTTMLGRYYDFVDDPREADFAVIHILSPEGNWGYSEHEVKEGGTGYVPISLQYTDYTAEYARESSLAGGDPKENFIDRGYKGKSEKTYNIDDLNVIINTKNALGDKPVIVMVQTDRPFIPEFEPYADAVLLGFGVSNQAFLDIVSGEAEPYGLLPLQLPQDMKTVEEQFEDVGRDMDCYVDADGNSYDFAFGLNWKGVINDWRVEKYK